MKVYDQRECDSPLVSRSPLGKTFAKLPASIRDYLDAVFELADQEACEIVSIMIFGSAAKGGFTPVSDVDLLIVLADEVPWKEKVRLKHELGR